MTIDAEHLARQRAWSERTFGPGLRTGGVIDHIRKELREIEAEPLDLGEWVDVVILALDGAWRAGHEPQAIIDAIRAKQARNESRAWPDWRTMDADHPIEHVRVCGFPSSVTDARCILTAGHPGDGARFHRFGVADLAAGQPISR